jgi:hypothetical protein
MYIGGDTYIFLFPSLSIYLYMYIELVHGTGHYPLELNTVSFIPDIPLAWT